jgi:hypothetical protein
MRTARRLAPFVLAPLLAGCGGLSYQPRPSPRLAVVHDGTGLALWKNGQRYPVGMFGAGLDDAVRGNPRAEEEAQKYANKNIAGFVLNIFGSGASAGGAAWIIATEAQGTGTTTSRIGGLSLALGGLVLSLVANAVLASAPPHMWNAVNMYNDDLPAPWGFSAPRTGPIRGPVVPGYAPPAYTPGWGPLPQAQPTALPPTIAPPPTAAPPAPPSAPSAPPPSVPAPPP